MSKEKYYIVMVTDNNKKFLKLLSPDFDSIIGYVKKFQFGTEIVIRFYDVHKFDKFTSMGLASAEEQAFMNNGKALDLFMTDVETILDKLGIEEKK